MQVNKNIVIENARIGFLNFSGEEGKFNPKGRRNFCVFLDHDLGLTLEEDGWNVRWLRPREEDEDDVEQAYLQVAVSFENIPPKILMITSGGKTIMTDETIGLLDWAEIENVDLIIRPYNWDVNGKTGVKAYAKSMYVTIREDEFAHKYNDIPDSAPQGLSEDEY